MLEFYFAAVVLKIALRAGLLVLGLIGGTVYLWRRMHP